MGRIPFVILFLLSVTCVTHVTVAVPATTVVDEASNAADEQLERDMELLQGNWELIYEGQAGQKPKIRSVKTITGNRETIRRYDVESGELKHKHAVEFQLSVSGAVRVLTFFAPGGDPADGYSYVYLVDQKNFYDIPGLLHGEQYRNYQRVPRVWQWQRVKNESPASSTDKQP